MPAAHLAQHLIMGRYTTAILLAAAPRPAQANPFWTCYNFNCLLIPPVIIITLFFLGTSSCVYAHGHCSCPQYCAFLNAIAAILWTALFGLAMMGWLDQPGAWLFFALAALAATLSSVGADRRCAKGAGDDADEPPVVAPKEPD